MEGNPNEPWTDHHLHSGFLLHLMGVWLKNYQPEFYEDNFGVRVWANMAHMIMLDDVYQHLILQPNDEYYGPGDPSRKMANSPLGGYYHWALRQQRSQEFWQFTFFHIPVWRGLDISVGHFQGVYFGVNWNLVQSSDYHNPIYIGIDFVSKFILGYDKKTRVNINRVVIGPSFKMIGWGSVEIAFGFGPRIWCGSQQGKVDFTPWIGVGLR